MVEVRGSVEIVTIEGLSSVPVRFHIIRYNPERADGRSENRRTGSVSCDAAQFREWPIVTYTLIDRVCRFI